MKNRKKTPLELYIHIPFCVKKCDYCDFLSGPADEKLKKRYVDALLSEIRGIAPAEHLPGYEVISVFIGGGTPSLMEASDMERILKTLRKLFSFSEDVEITIEANPGTLTGEKLETYLETGINRLSLGLQSADNRELQMLGRIHTWKGFLDSYDKARKAGFTNINIDLMSAIPGQTYDGWIRNLRTTAALNPEHISAYSLIIEEETPFAERKLELPDEDTEYRMYEDTAAVLREYGFEQYEISNYARRGYRCRHNIGYWDRTEYLGLGLGASSLYGGARFRNTKSMSEYMKCSADPKKIRKDVVFLSQKDQEEEFMFLGLRMIQGVSEEKFEKEFGIALPEVYGKVLEKYREMDFLEKKGGFWRFTRKGIHVSNWILADFLQEKDK